MDREDDYILNIDSASLEKLFKFKGIDITNHDPKSFCGKLLEAIALKKRFEKIQLFAKHIEVRRRLSVGPQDDEPVIYVFEVDVVTDDDEMAVIERVCVIFFCSSYYVFFQ